MLRTFFFCSSLLILCMHRCTGCGGPYLESPSGMLAHDHLGGFVDPTLPGHEGPLLANYGGLLGKPGPRRQGDPEDLTLLNAIAEASRSRGEDLCYWANQYIAPPSWNTFNFSDWEAGMVSIFLEAASDRLASLMTPTGPIQYAGCSVGKHVWSRKCDLGMDTPVPCGPAVTNMTITWPDAMSIWKITPENFQRVANLIYRWRTEWTLHRPQMDGTFTTGSGVYLWASADSRTPTYGGAGMYAKVVPCSSIPKSLSLKHRTCDVINSETGITHNQEIYDAWAKACNVFQHPSFPSTLGPCSGPAPAPRPGPVPKNPSWACSVCTHVYDASKDGNGVAFDDLPDSWKCPVCGAPKSAFRQHVLHDGTPVWAHEDEAVHV